MISELDSIEHDEIWGYGLYKNSMMFAWRVKQGVEQFIIMHMVFMCDCI